MTRTNAREIAMHFLFELGFSNSSAEDLLAEHLTKERFAELGKETPLYSQFPNKKQEVYIRNLVTGAFVHSYELDEYISKYAKGWSFSRIPRAVATLMRVAMFEILYMPDIPDSAAINDALEIAKGYDEPEVISFMNGILGSFVRTEMKNTPSKPSNFVEDLFDLEESDEEVISATIEKAEKSPEESVEGQ